MEKLEQKQGAEGPAVRTLAAALTEDAAPAPKLALAWNNTSTTGPTEEQTPLQL